MAACRVAISRTRSASAAADWAYSDRSSKGLFASVEHRFDSDWVVKGTYNHYSTEYDEVLGYAAGGYPDPVTGAGAKPYGLAAVETIRIESGLVDPADVEGDLGTLARAYRQELDRLGLWDRESLRRSAVERLRGDLSAWGDAPVFAYGFEDLTGAEWALIEVLAARAEVMLSIPYEPGRAAFAALERTVTDLAGLAGDFP